MGGSLLSLIGLVLAPGAQGQDWPSFRHDVTRSGKTSEQVEAAELGLAWRRGFARPRPAWPGPARWDAYAALPGLKSMRNYDPVYHPVVVGDALFFSSSADGAVRCLDLGDGSTRWSYVTAGPVRLPPQVEQGRVYFGSDDGAAYCLDAQDGSLIWRFHPTEEASLVLHEGRLISQWPIRTGVVVRDGHAYFGASFLPWQQSYLCALDAASGKARGRGNWVRTLGTGLTLEGAMLASEKHLVVPQGRVAPLLFDRDEGSAQGSLEGGGGSFCLLTEDEQILHGPGNKTGWITGSVETGGAKVASYQRGNAIVVDGPVAYLLGERSLSALDRRTQAVLWSRPCGTPLTLIQSGQLLYCGGDGLVRAFTVEDGAEVGAWSVPGKVHGVIAAHGNLIVATDRGELLALRVGGGLKANASAGSSPVTALAAAPDPLPSSTASLQLQPPPPLPRLNGTGLVDHWVFQSDAVDQVAVAAGDPRTVPQVRNLARTGLAARPLGPLRLEQSGAAHLVRLDGSQGDLEVGTLTEVQARLPQRAISVAAWVRVDVPIEWGGVAGAAQDNGSYERGWLLGFRQRRFGFALCGEGGEDRLTWLVAPSDFQAGSWHHVVGSYDGREMRLYVDGEQVASSKAQSGDIAYPEDGWYHLGAYRDNDEYFRMTGALAEVRVYQRALRPAEVEKQFALRDGSLTAVSIGAEPAPPPKEEIVLQRGPWIRLHADGAAEISWEAQAGQDLRLQGLAPAQVQGPDGRPLADPSDPAGSRLPDFQVVERSRANGVQRTVLQGLTPDRVAHFHLVEAGNPQAATRAFELDTHFAYARAPFRPPLSMPGVDLAMTKLLQGGMPAPGWILVAGDRSIQIAGELAAGAAGPRVLLRVEDAAQAAALRRDLLLDQAASRLQVIERDQLLPPAFVDLVIAPELSAKEPSQIETMLRPGGAWIDPDGELLLRRGPLPGSGDWTHMYGRPDNSAYGGEDLAGVDSRDQLAVQWVGPPGPRYQSDRQNRKPAPLAANGRLYAQGLNRVLALNAFHGEVLWSWELPALQRFNVPRDCSNWCADADDVFLAIEDQCWRLNGADGSIEMRIDLPPSNRMPVVGPPLDGGGAPSDGSSPPLDGTSAPSDGSSGASADTAQRAWHWGYLARVDDLLLGSRVQQGASFTEWWGGERWYDARDGEAASKVASDQLFALDAEQGSRRWSYSGSLILNPTVTVAEGRVFFLETRDRQLIQGASRRLAGDRLWQSLEFVALDLASGEELWRRDARPMPGVTALYLAHGKKKNGDGRLILTSSAAGEIAVYTFDPADGAADWRIKFAWEVDHHGKPLSRPATVGGLVYLRPLVLDLDDGTIVQQAFPEGHQCGSYALSTHAAILRCGELGMWSSQDWQATRWPRLRPDCWISTIPACGLLLSPEGGGGCSCGSWIETSVAFRPRSLGANR